MAWLGRLEAELKGEAGDDDGPFEDEGLPKPFQQEVRAHLLAIQRKLNAVLHVHDSTCGEAPSSPQSAADVLPVTRTHTALSAPPAMSRFLSLESVGTQVVQRESSMPNLDFALPGTAQSARGRFARGRKQGQNGQLSPSQSFLPVIVREEDEQRESTSDRAQDWRGAVNVQGSITSPTMSCDRKRLGKLRSWLNLEEDQATASIGASTFARVSQSTRNACSTHSMKWEEVKEGFLWKLVHGVPFQVLSSTMIVLNVLMIGVIAEVRLESALKGTEGSMGWTRHETAFSAWFTFELLLRIAAERMLFLLGQEWRWNLFDTVLVAFSIFDLVIGNAEPGGMSNITVGKALRFARFVRIVRIARLVRAFHSLRIVVFAIFESMVSLVWCVVVVGLIIYTFALLLLYGVTEHVEMSGAEAPGTQELQEYYGGVLTAMLSLFKTISGGVDWENAMRPLRDVHWVYELLFVFYVFFMVIGVLNVVVGAFVAATADISARDREALVKAEIQSLQGYERKIKTFFQEADRDKSGMLTWSEFREHLKEPKVSAYFRALELDTSQAHVLFKLLDSDGSNQVSLDEFLQGCIRLKGQARSLEVNMLLYENKRLFRKLSSLFEVMSTSAPAHGGGSADGSLD